MKALTNSTTAVLLLALEILGPSGKKWARGTLSDRKGRHCMRGAVNLARRRLKVKGDAAIRLLHASVKDERFEGWQWNVQNFNDWPQRKFADVRLAIQLAIALSIVHVERERSLNQADGKVAA
jgi:hypothetical protein